MKHSVGGGWTATMTGYRPPRRRIGAALAALIMTAITPFTLGCASASPSSPAATEPRALPRPPVIVVYDFATSFEEVTEDQPLFQDLSDAENGGFLAPTPYQRKLGREAAQTVGTELVRGIVALGFQAEHAAKGKRVSANAVIVHGAFLDVVEGRRLQRIIVGVNPAGLQLDLRLHVHQAGPDGAVNLLECLTHTESRELASDGAAEDDRSVMEQLAARSATQVLALLSDLFLKEGWMSARIVREVRQGKMQFERYSRERSQQERACAEQPAAPRVIRVSETASP